MPSEFARRLASFGPDIRLGLDDLGFTDPDSVYASVIAIAERNYSERTKKLKARDLASRPIGFRVKKLSAMSPTLTGLQETSMAWLRESLISNPLESPIYI